MKLNTAAAPEVQQHLDTFFAGRLAISATELGGFVGLSRVAVRHRIDRGSLDVDVVSLGAANSGVMITVASVYRLFGCVPPGACAPDGQPEVVGVHIASGRLWCPRCDATQGEVDSPSPAPDAD